MLKRNLLLIFCFVISFGIAQEDSSNTHKKYWEDQLYFGLNYNVLINQPSGVDPSKVSYGVQLGYIKDIPVNKKGTTAFGLGIGYSYDFFSHSLVVNNAEEFSINANVSNNKLKIYNVEVPIQFRIRTSDAVTYSFWRLYVGARFSYTFSHKFQYTLADEDLEFFNIDNFNKFQTGIEFSGGYGAFNLYAYYGLTPIFDNALLNDENINTSILKIGLIFYLL